jgi:hypothetical protein
MRTKIAGSRQVPPASGRGLPKSVLVVLAAWLVVTGCQGSTTDPPEPAETSIAFFSATATMIDRGGTVSLSWLARDVGTVDGVASCTMTRRAEGEEPDEPFSVACTGTIDDVPPASPSSSYVRYQLSVLKQPLDLADPYLTAVVTVTFKPEEAATSITYFYAERTKIPRGEAASLHWQVVSPGGTDGVDACSIVRRAEGASPSEPTVVPCVGHLDEVPVATPSATFVEYELRARQRTEDASEPTLTRTVTVAFEDGIPAGGDERWVRQIGSSAQDVAWSVAADGAGHLLVAGYTFGSLAGPNAGDRDVFVMKLAPTGSTVWARQLGSAGDDFSRDVAVDGAGNVVVTGYTSGSLFDTISGSRDAFVAKFDAAGDLLWGRQMSSGGVDSGWGVAVDGAGNIVVAGSTEGLLGDVHHGGVDAFVTKFDPSGTPLWTRQFGTGASDAARAVAVDGAGNVLLTGYTRGGLSGSHRGSEDVFVVKLSPAGMTLWTKQLGTGAHDIPRGIVADGAGDIIVVGYTGGSLWGANQGESDVFVVKLNAAGGEVWGRQVGTPASDIANGVATDGARNVLVAGYASGDLAGPHRGGVDAFVMKYDAAGDVVWTRQFGTTEADYAMGVAADGAASVLVAGYTGGDLAQPLSGVADVFVAVLEP